jgi:hypothetical protein
VDLTISDNQQDVVHFGVIMLLNILSRFPDNISESGWSHLLDFMLTVIVSLHYTLYTIDIRIISIAIQRETMTDLFFTHKFRYTTKTVKWKLLVGVVLAKNIAN